MGGPGSGATPKSQGTDWDGREAGEAARKLAAAREAVSSPTLSRALEAYEGARDRVGEPDAARDSRGHAQAEAAPWRELVPRPPRCFCVHAVSGKREARVLWMPGCPAHPGAPQRLSARLLPLPAWLRKGKRRP
jgi:hypothetical protein